MRIVRAFFVLSALAVAALEANAASFNAVNVNLPYTVTAGEQVLAPGDYVIKPVSGRSDIFAVYKDGGMQFETFVWAVGAQKGLPATKTELVLHGDGNEYVMDQLWIEGDNRGFQFLNPASNKLSEQHISELTAGLVR
jgi:hypothetical protein